MSLLGSIFGAKDDSKEEVSASNLFDKSKSLPDRPQHKALPPLPPRKQEEEKSEEPLKKKRKRKEKTEPEPKKKTTKDEQHKETGGVVKEQVNEEEQTAPATQEGEQPTDGADDRTIFVGNLPLNTTRKSLAALFRPCGKVESTRLRSVAAAGVKLPPERAGDQVCRNRRQ